MSKSIMSLRIDSGLKDSLATWADEDNRTISNFAEALFMQEADRRAGHYITLVNLDDKLNRLDDKLNRVIDLVKPKQRAKGEKAQPSAYEMDLGDESIVDHDHWKAWIDHLHNKKIHLTYYDAERHYNLLKKYDEIFGLDTNKLLEHLIDNNAGKVYLPESWIRELKLDRNLIP